MTLLSQVNLQISIFTPGSSLKQLPPFPLTFQFTVSRVQVDDISAEMGHWCCLRLLFWKYRKGNQQIFTCGVQPDVCSLKSCNIHVERLKCLACNGEKACCKQGYCSSLFSDLLLDLTWWCQGEITQPRAHSGPLWIHDGTMWPPHFSHFSLTSQKCIKVISNATLRQNSFICFMVQRHCFMVRKALNALVFFKKKKIGTKVFKGQKKH